MREERCEFYSEGIKLAGILRLPDEPSAGALPTLVHGPGWLGLKDTKMYAGFHEVFTQNGYAVFTFDYRGFGDSEGERGWVNPFWQVQDIRNAITYLTTRPEVDPTRIGLYGSGGTGGGVAAYTAAMDQRVQSVVMNVGIGNGTEWLRRMRREYEWHEFLARLAEDEQRWATSGTGEMVSAREELMVATPERKQTSVKKDVDSKVPEKFYLRCARYILDFKPEDVVHLIAPRSIMIVCVENDAVTATEQSIRLFERAAGPRRLVVQRNTTHYAAYSKYFDDVTPLAIGWFDEYLKYGAVRPQTSTSEILYIGG